MDPTLPSDIELVRRAQAMDSGAFEDLMCRYERLVFKVAMSFARDREGGLDLVQNVFLKAFRGIDALGPDSNFKAWLMRITFNEGVNWTRRHGRHAGHQPIDVVNDVASHRPGPDSDLDQRDRSEQLARGLALLRPRYRTAISLRYFHGVPLREIAELLDCSESSVKQLLFRGVRSLRDVVAAAAEPERSAVPLSLAPRVER